MSWEEELFAVLDDLEQQAEAAYGAERLAELADRSRAEYAAVTLASRLAASIGREVVLDVAGLGPLRGEVSRTARGWLLLSGAAPGGSQEWVVPTSAVRRVQGASDRSLPEAAWSPLGGLGLGSALRRLAAAGQRCVLHLVDGSAFEAVLARVGADFVEARVAQDRLELVAFGALAAVQSREADG